MNGWMDGWMGDMGNSKIGRQVIFFNLIFKVTPFWYSKTSENSDRQKHNFKKLHTMSKQNKIITKRDPMKWKKKIQKRKEKKKDGMSQVDALVVVVVHDE